MIGWIFIISLSFSLNIYLMKINTSKIVKNKAESFFKEIVTTRLWNSIYGGVYVPVTEETQPNPYLKVSDRDIETTTGLKLTKINPSYMTRQIAELSELQNDIKYHLTSLNPIRPANKADDWETKVLKDFEKNPESIMEKVTIDSVSNYRYMKPLITEMSCLDCHAKQGYEVGDIRGGISISFSDKVYNKTEIKQTVALSLIHLIVLFLGIIGLKYYERMSNKFLFELEIKNEKLEENQIYQQRMNKVLTEINATKDKFFSIIAHDLRGPFNSILGFSNLLLEEFQDLPDEQKHEMVHIISESASSSYDLLENLLMWSRAQTGKIKYNPEKVDIKELIDSLISLYKSQSKNKEIIIKNNIHESFELISDKNVIETILRNLVSNAIKYTNKGGVITLDCVALCNNGATKIIVTDTGVGMSKKTLSELFKVDNNNSTDGTEKEKGTGLGLILCKELVKIIGGEIEVESKEGFGSEFKFTIP
jgi:signal transduction histidine kinase